MRVEGAFDQIVEPATFQAAQRLLTERTRQTTDSIPAFKAEDPDKLARLLKEKGYLTTEMINAAEAYHTARGTGSDLAA